MHLVHRLQASYEFSDNVELLDGGTLGLRLLDPITQADHVIVIDAVQNGAEPGTIHKISAEVLAKKVAFKNSIHQLDLVETLAYAEVLGRRPTCVILGIEPLEIAPWGTSLTPPVAAKLGALEALVLEEIHRAGGTWALKADGSPEASEEMGYVFGDSGGNHRH